LYLLVRTSEDQFHPAVDDASSIGKIALFSSLQHSTMQVLAKMALLRIPSLFDEFPSTEVAFNCQLTSVDDNDDKQLTFEQALELLDTSGSDDVMSVDSNCDRLT